MRIEISSTEAVRHFGDCLARIRYRGDSYIITKNGEPVAELTAAPGARRATWGEVRNALKALPQDPGFADDLELATGTDRVPDNPWA